MSGLSPLESSLIAKIYDAALDSAQWPMFLDQLASLLPAGRAALLLNDIDAQVSQCAYAARVPQELQQEYAAYYGAHDPWILAGQHAPVGVVMAGEQMVARATLRRSEYYHDFLRRMEVERIDAAALVRTDTRMMVVSVNSAGSAEDATEFRALLQRLVPHLQRAAQIHRQFSALAARGDAAETALDALTMGVLLVGPDGDIRFLNAAARRILAAQSDLYLDRTGRLRARATEYDRTLARLLHEAIATGMGRGTGAGGGFALPTHGALPPMTLLVTPLPASRSALGIDGAAAAVLVSDPAALQSIPAHRLAAQFGLTARESQLFSLLLEGKTPEEVAGQLRVSITTVRTHLRHLLNKMNCARQADLMRVALNSVAVMVNRNPPP